MVNFTGSACAGLVALAGLAIIVTNPAAGQSSAPSASTGTIKAMPKRTVTRPGTMPRRATRNMHRNIDPKKMLPTGAGTRVVGPVDFHVPGGQTIAGPTSNPVQIVKHNDRSYLHIYGTVHAGGMSYYSAAPQFRELNKIISNRPKECPVFWSGGAQAKEKNHYAATIRFDNTGSNGVCWQYFRSFKSLDVSAHVIAFKEHSKDYGPELIAATDGKNRVATVGPVIPATQSASK